MASAYNNTARVFKAFCDVNRLQILELLQSGDRRLQWSHPWLGSRSCKALRQ